MTISATPSLADLQDRRVAVLNEIDDIINTATERGEAVEGVERARHDELVAEHDDLVRSIATIEAEAETATISRAQADRKARYSVPNINLGHTPARAGRSLDELLWATDEVVRAGSFDKTGGFRQHSTAVNPVEQVIVRSGDDTMAYAPRLGEFRPEDRAVVRSFQQTVADMALFGMLIDPQARTSAQGFQVARAHAKTKGRYAEILRALDVDTSGEGNEWVPTGIGATLHEKVRAAGKVAALFPRIDLPTNPWKWPLEGADATAYRVAEPTSDTASKVTASTPGSGAATFDAEIFGGRVLFSRSLEADSALAILPYAQRKLVLAFVDAEEKAILDGDTDGTHQDGDVGSSTTDARTAWDGLRKKALAETSTATTTTSTANLAAIRKSLKKWGVNPADLAFIVGVSSYHVLTTDSNLLTVDKMGPNATILNGQVGSVFGIPVIVSEHVREDLNASGVQDGITSTKTYALCVNRGEWAMGQRMALDVQADDSIYRESFQRVLVGFMREDFQSIAGAAANDDTAIGYNITSGS